MEKYDLHLTIGKKSDGADFYPLTIKDFEGTRSSGKLRMPKGVEGPGVSKLSGIDLGFHLYTSLLNSKLWPLLEKHFESVQSSYSHGALLLEIKSPELYPLPWENIFDYSFLGLNNLSEAFVVLRYLPRPSSIVTTPLQLPIDVLIASDSSDETRSLLPTEDSLQYFRSTKTTMASASHLENMMANIKYDIVHICGRAVSSARVKSVLIPTPDTSGFAVSELRSLLRRCGARLLILQSVDDSYEELLRFAHFLHNADGPSVLVAKSHISMEAWKFDSFYMDIVHNNPLDRIVMYASSSLRPALFLSEGGADVLSLFPVPQRLISLIRGQVETMKDIRQTLVEQNFLKQLPKVERLEQEEPMAWPLDKILLPMEKDSDLYQDEIFDYDEMPSIEEEDHKADKVWAEPISDDLDFVQRSIPELEEIIASEDSFDFSHESGAMEPLTSLEMISEAVGKRLMELDARTKRVVNTWFRDGESQVGKKENLKPDTWYTFDLQIGAASRASNVKNAVAFPEKELARYFSSEGLSLQIVLYSSEFEIRAADQTLLLPPSPKESNTATFELKTPEKTGAATLRACIYYEQNLIQSLLVRAYVGRPGSKAAGRGNEAIVDYSLSGRLNNIERLPARTLNIAVNERSNGTHSFYIAGSNLRRHFDFGEGEITSSVAEVRKALQTICSEKDRFGGMRYRYGTDNRGNETEFIKDVIALAELGSILYAELITHQDRAFQDQLIRTLGPSGAVIQISSTKSAKYVFPWALAYDKPLVQGEYDVCPQFLKDLRESDQLTKQICLQGQCPNATNTSIVCPSGFWGYKHIIEQPITLDHGNPAGMQEIPIEITSDRANVSAMMGVSLKLSDIDTHLDELKNIGGMDIDMMTSKQQIGIGLQRKDFHIIYFYCHGGRKGAQTWLGVGKEEKLLPKDLVAGWRVDWPTLHPIVFINGCHTVDVTPDDLINFNRTFSWCKASGILGTEVTIPETLARHFATGFFRNFLNGDSVGEAIRDQRLAMLANYNLLGLAYTPYCSASLKLTNTN